MGCRGYRKHSDWGILRLLGSVVVADRTVNAVVLGSNPSLAAIGEVVS